MFMMWYDDGKKTATDKIAEAVAAYIRHFKTPPNVVLVHPDDKEATAGPRITVRAVNYVRAHNFWVGWEEASIQEQA